MKASELRIGNLINMPFLGNLTLTVIGIALCENGKTYIQAKDKRSIFFELPEKYEGVPLTEEWLLKFGFEERYSKYEEAVTMDYLLQPLYFDTANQSIKINGVYQDISYPIYVHQLQNLVFALTQTELVYETK